MKSVKSEVYIDPGSLKLFINMLTAMYSKIKEKKTGLLYESSRKLQTWGLHTYFIYSWQEQLKSALLKMSL